MFYRTVDVYAIHYRARQAGAEMEWEQQMVETVNNTINHMVGEWLVILAYHLLMQCSDTYQDSSSGIRKKDC